MRQIPPQTGVAFTLGKGQRLRVTDPQGQQVSDLFCFNREDLGEWLSSGRSVDYADTLLLTVGHALYSNRSRPMLRILEDEVRRHDFLLTPCSLKMFQLVAGNEAWHPSCHENLARNLAPFGVSPDQISTTFNIFMNVIFEPSGRIHIEPPPSRAGQSIVFQAEMDLLVGLTACSHEETNAGRCKPITYELMGA